MSCDIPTDLIRQVQILTRKESGVPEYDPNDPTLPPLPSVSATIATLDPSPPYLRCKRCRGRLLRGLQSLICIYCGQKQHLKDGASAPDPISFNSTVSYHWLLQSLRLDGSEKVGPPIEKGEKSEFNREHSTLKDSICLSELLDFKIRLFNKHKKSEISGTNQEPQGNSSLNYDGFDLDSFFPRPKGDNTSAKQPATMYPSKDEEAKTLGNHDYSLFETVQSLQQAATPFQNYKSGDFSGWEADFRSADSGTQSVSKTLDPVTGSTVDSGSQVGSFKSADAFADSATDLSAHMDSIFASGNNLYGSKKGDESETLHKASDWSSDDLWNNATTEVFQQKGPFDSNGEVNDYHQNSLNTPTNVDFFEEDQWPTHFSSAPNSNATNIDEDAFDDWNDFTSSSNVNAPQEKAITQNDNLADDHLDTLVFDHAAEPGYDSMTAEPGYDSMNVDGNMFDDWNDFTSATVIKEPQANGETKNNQVANALENTFVDMDFGSFSHSDLISTSHDKESVCALGTETPRQDHSTDSTMDTKCNLNDGSGKAMMDGDAFNTSSTQSENDIENLFSQMHDLSFMLESNLSIPPKPDVHTNPLD